MRILSLLVYVTYPGQLQVQLAGQAMLPTFNYQHLFPGLEPWSFLLRVTFHKHKIRPNSHIFTEFPHQIFFNFIRPSNVTSPIPHGHNGVLQSLGVLATAAALLCRKVARPKLYTAIC